MTTIAEPAPAPQSELQLVYHVPPVRVLHVVPSLHGGGMEHALLRLITGIANWENDPPQQNVIHGICVLKNGDPELIDRCRLTAATWVLGDATARPQKRQTWRRLRGIIAEFDPDVVHARTTSAWFDAAFALRQFPRTRLMLSFHGRTSLDPPGWLRRQINYWTCRRADAVLTVSCEAARMLENEWRVPSHKIRVIPNAVDTEQFQPRQGHCGDSPQLPARKPADHIVICVANLLPIKGLDTLLKNWRKVVMADPNAMLWIVGEGPMREPLQLLARTLRITDNVEFLGRRDDVPDLLRAADLFVLPSNYEASSNAAIEAMASGLPVVAFDVGGMSELVRPNHTGWLVPRDQPDRLADTLLAALIDRSARQRTGQTARRAVLEEHALDDWIHRYATLYRSLTEGGNPTCAV